MAEKITVYEVGLRDGLQAFPTFVETEKKLRIHQSLYRAGIRNFEATSFVSPKAIPQMADAQDLLPRCLQQAPDAHHHALIINEKGYHRAKSTECKSIALVAILTETLCQKNNRMSRKDCLERVVQLIKMANHDGIQTRVYVASAWVCPYEGPVSQDQVFETVEALFNAHPNQIALADTIGQAHPQEVAQLFHHLRSRFDIERFAAHLHDTCALGLANAAAAIHEGVRTIDASIGGLGGCPFAPGSAGNLATEDLVLMIEKMRFSTNIDLAKLWQSVEETSRILEKPLGGRTKDYWNSRR